MRKHANQPNDLEDEWVPRTSASQGQGGPIFRSLLSFLFSFSSESADFANLPQILADEIPPAVPLHDIYGVEKKQTMHKRQFTILLGKNHFYVLHNLVFAHIVIVVHTE